MIVKGFWISVALFVNLFILPLSAEEYREFGDQKKVVSDADVLMSQSDSVFTTETESEWNAKFHFKKDGKLSIEIDAVSDFNGKKSRRTSIGKWSI